MTKDIFEDQYISKSEMTVDEYNKDYITMPCKCKDESCCGWASVCNDELSIKTHLKLYS